MQARSQWPSELFKVVYEGLLDIHIHEMRSAENTPISRLPAGNISCSKSPAIDPYGFKTGDSSRTVRVFVTEKK